MPSYTIRVNSESEAEVTDVMADRVERSSEGDLVFYESSTTLGVTKDRHVARFAAGRWEYYYETEDEL